MYRIKLTSGDEANYGSIDELAQAVKAGTVTDTAAIYHARAEKWLPIASHPHYKMAKERASPRTAGGAPSASRPAVTGSRPAGGPATNGGSGQRPALGASGQRPAVGVSAQRTAVPTAPRASGTHATSPGSAPQSGSRVSTAERPVRAPIAERRTAPQAAVPEPRPVLPKPDPVAPSESPASNALGLVQADGAIEQEKVGQAPLKGVEIEQTPTIAEPEVVAQQASVTIEQEPAPLKLVSHDAPPSADRIELIHPDRSVSQGAPMTLESIGALGGVMEDASDAPMGIPAPIHDFASVEPAELHAVGARSRAPLFIGLGLAAAAAIGALAFLRTPSTPAPAVTETRTAPTPVTAPAAAPTAVGAAAGDSTVDRVAQAGAQSQGTSSRRRRDTQPDPEGEDGLEPPPRVVLPAAPSVSALTDAASLPTVEAEAPDLVNRKKALEQTVREIDSSMRRESGKSGGSTR
jgi:hypothetical protein